MKRKGLKKNKKGFTLVEVIVVLVIIGILLALAVPAITQYVGKAADTKINTQIESAFTGAQTYSTSYIAEHPGADKDALKTAVTKDAVNGELGLEESNDAYITNLTCNFNESKKITACEITTTGSGKSYLIKPNGDPAPGNLPKEGN